MYGGADGFNDLGFDALTAIDEENASSDIYLQVRDKREVWANEVSVSN